MAISLFPMAPSNSASSTIFGVRLNRVFTIFTACGREEPLKSTLLIFRKPLASKSSYCFFSMDDIFPAMAISHSSRPFNVMSSNGIISETELKSILPRNFAAACMSLSGVLTCSSASNGLSAISKCSLSISRVVLSNTTPS